MKKFIIILGLILVATACRAAELKFASPQRATNIVTDLSVTKTNSTNFLASFVLLETNMIVATATLDFPSTPASTANVLLITATGARPGDAIFLGVPNESMNIGIGPDTEPFHYMGWASNDVVRVKFVNASVVNTFDPASGVFKVIVFKP